ncbi:erg24, C-14 sterol reductase [Kickxella alabastrina]|uniref:Erg24, C-14 sterol reductase n=1 Tax=Kickxella alabastrina TaxID=61397 RepID=A0ACC1IX20_9FUNG|nr:erg24, C-14 sterol reductase [Kickxella alabastrina]
MASKVAPKAATGPLNPKTVHREFFGFPGSVVIIATTTIVLYTWNFSCNVKDGCELPLTAERWAHIFAGAMNYQNYLSLEAFKYYVMWWTWLAALYFIIPATNIQGVVLRDGQRLSYLMNGFSSLLVTTLVTLAVYMKAGTEPFLWIADHFFELAVASWIFATSLALFVYIYSFRHSYVERPGKPTVMLGLAGNSGNPVYDFFIGRELNPRIGSLDVKVFCELRPGIMGWILLNVCFAIKQYKDQGSVSVSMWLAIVPQIWYCIETLIFEDKVLTTMDVTTDGFGWMLSFGDLTWVPFMYTVQARYLSFTPVTLSTPYAAFLAGMATCSYLVFRLSNNEKNAFRTNPNDPKVQHLKYITTESGSRLLISGWWGAARHINYTGDWMLGLAQCLATGMNTPMTYFFSGYFLVLLVHRNYRDEHKCHEKYKKDWDKYCEIVPYMFIPYVI